MIPQAGFQIGETASQIGENTSKINETLKGTIKEIRYDIGKGDKKSARYITIKRIGGGG